jgi:hypothetical protein
MESARCHRDLFKQQCPKEKTGPNPTDRAKRGVKRSLLVEGHGIPIGLEVEGANRNDFKMLQATLQSIPIARPEPTEEQRQNLCLDKGYDYNEVRELGKVFGYTLHIRARKEEAQALKRQVGWKRKTLGGGAHTQLDESLSRGVDSLGEKGRELSRPAPSRLCLYYLPSCWPIGIGSKHPLRRRFIPSNQHGGFCIPPRNGALGFTEASPSSTSIWWGDVLRLRRSLPY